MWSMSRRTIRGPFTELQSWCGLGGSGIRGSTSTRPVFTLDQGSAWDFSPVSAGAGTTGDLTGTIGKSSTITGRTYPTAGRLLIAIILITAGRALTDTDSGAPPATADLMVRSTDWSAGNTALVPGRTGSHRLVLRQDCTPARSAASIMVVLPAATPSVGAQASEARTAVDSMAAVDFTVAAAADRPRQPVSKY